MTNLAIKLLLNDIENGNCFEFRDLLSSLAFQSMLVVGYLEGKPGYISEPKWKVYEKISENNFLAKEYTAILSRFMFLGEQSQELRCDELAELFFNRWDIEIKRIQVSDHVVFFTIMVLSLLCFNMGWLSGRGIKVDSIHLRKSLKIFFLKKRASEFKEYFFFDGKFNDCFYNLMNDGLDNISDINNKVYESSIIRGCSIEYSLMSVLISILVTNKRYRNNLDPHIIEELDQVGYLCSIKSDFETQSKIEKTLFNLEERFHDELDKVEYVILLTVTWFFYQLDNINYKLH